LFLAGLGRLWWWWWWWWCKGRWICVWLDLVWSGLVGELQRWRHVGAGLIHLLGSLLALCAEQDSCRRMQEMRLECVSIRSTLSCHCFPHLCLPCLPCPAPASHLLLSLTTHATLQQRATRNVSTELPNNAPTISAQRKSSQTTPPYRLVVQCRDSAK
jgi:hypothetical protein